MDILGIVTKTHDTGIALLSDGIPALVLEEERFNREKHTLLFPSLSLKSAFDAQGRCFDDIDVVTTPWDMQHLRWSVFSAVMDGLPQSLHLLRPSAHRGQGTAIVNLPMRLWLGLGRRFGFSKVPKIVQVAHHDAHAAIFFVSPFEEAAVLVMDGYGDEAPNSAYTASGNRLTPQWKDDFFDSLGMLYTAVFPSSSIPASTADNPLSPGRKRLSQAICVPIWTSSFSVISTLPIVSSPRGGLIQAERTVWTPRFRHRSLPT